MLYFWRRRQFWWFPLYPDAKACNAMSVDASISPEGKWTLVPWGPRANRTLGSLPGTFQAGSAYQWLTWRRARLPRDKRSRCTAGVIAAISGPMLGQETKGGSWKGKGGEKDEIFFFARPSFPLFASGARRDNGVDTARRRHLGDYCSS